MIYILFPTPAEFEPLSLLMDSPDAVMLGRRYGVSGMLAGRPITAVVSGVGQANTAMTVAALLEKVDAELVILGGCAGAYPGSGLAVGDVAVATREVYAELGVETPDSWKPLSDIGLPLLDMDGARYYETFDLPHCQMERALDVSAPSSPSPPAGEGGRGAGGGSSINPPLLPGEGVGGEGVPLGVRVFSGTFLTVSTISGTAARGRKLFARYGALCENMEGAAAAQTAALYGVPFAEVRGISNMVEDRDRDAWDIPAATANCALVIERIVRTL